MIKFKVVNITAEDSPLWELNVDSSSFDALFTSLSVDTPYFVVKQYLRFSKDSNGYILIDSAVRNGLGRYRFARFRIKDGWLDPHIRYIDIEPSSLIRRAADDNLRKYRRYLKYTSAENI